MNQRTRKTPALATLTLGAIALLFCPGAKSGCGSKEANETLTSPVQAVTTLLERADGTVDARLVLISTAVSPNEFVDSARDAQVRIPSGAFVPLVSASPGHYTASSTTDDGLVYEPGGTYQFRFELDDEAAAKDVAGGSFVAVMEAPDDKVSASFDPAPAFAGDLSTLTWSPAERYAIVSIQHDDTGEVTYSTFDFSVPKFDGSKWARLKKGGSLEFGVDAFPDTGSYTVSVCMVDKTSDFDKNLSAELGMLSGFLIGRCAEDIVVDVP